MCRFSSNEPVQLENHMRGALLLGATPREVLEVIVHSTAYAGMPTTVLTVRTLERIASLPEDRVK